MQTFKSQLLNRFNMLPAVELIEATERLFAQVAMELVVQTASLKNQGSVRSYTASPGALDQGRPGLFNMILDILLIILVHF